MKDLYPGNLFDIYSKSHNIKVLNYEQWINETEYKLGLKESALDIVTEE